MTWKSTERRFVYDEENFLEVKWTDIYFQRNVSFLKSNNPWAETDFLKIFKIVKNVETVMQEVFEG